MYVINGRVDDVECVGGPSQSFNNAETLTAEQHILRELTPATEILPVRVAPVREAPIAFALVMSMRLVHFTEPSLDDLHGFDDREGGVLNR